MADDILHYKCPNCAAPLTFDGGTQKMTCESCGTEISVADFEAYDQALKTSTTGETDVGTYKETVMDGGTEQYCKSCGGELLTDGNTVATECPYCGNTVIVTQKVTNVLKPDFVIPFQIDKENAQKRLKEFYKGKPLLPKTFKDENRLDKLQGVYVPFWLYDCDADGAASYDAERVKRWTSGDIIYTKTDRYLLVREGSMRFEKVPVDGSEKMDDTVMESIEPYDDKGLKSFSMAYLSGYLADKHDNDFEQKKPRIVSRINSSMDSALQNTVSGYSSVRRKGMNVGVRNAQIHYAMYPVWLLNTKWRDKMYNFTMNAQTGRAVGELPSDGKKFFLYGAIAFAAVFAILTLCALGASLLTAGVVWLGIAVVSLLAAVITCVVLKSKMKTVKRRPDARSYAHGFSLTQSRDIFVSSRTTSQRVYKPPTNTVKR